MNLVSEIYGDFFLPLFPQYTQQVMKLRFNSQYVKLCTFANPQIFVCLSNLSELVLDYQILLAFAL